MRSTGYDETFRIRALSDKSLFVRDSETVFRDESITSGANRSNSGEFWKRIYFGLPRDLSTPRNDCFFFVVVLYIRHSPSMIIRSGVTATGQLPKLTRRWRVPAKNQLRHSPFDTCKTIRTNYSLAIKHIIIET